MAKDQVLAHIAATLGCSVEELGSGEATPPDMKNVLELLAIWAKLDELDRDRLLSHAQQIEASRYL